MLKGEEIICISWLVKDSIPLVMHHMMQGLSKHNRVLFVDPPVAYSNLLIDPGLWKNHLKKTRLWLKGIRDEGNNLHVLFPPPLILQYGHFSVIDRINRFYITQSIKRAAGRLGFKSPILWIYHPYVLIPDGAFNEKLTCYDCNDDVSFFFCTYFDKKERLKAVEKRLTAKSDLVFATSKRLYELRKSQNDNTHYLPSGLDVNLFQSALSPSLKTAPELSNIKGPVIGFVGGMVNIKMNWEWIDKASSTHRDWTFVFVGPCNDKPPQYILENKRHLFLGERRQQELPHFIKGFDVCIIPYKGEDFLKNCQPTKAFEYLAAGKPVVSSRIPELESTDIPVRLSKNADDFTGNIEMAIIEGREEKNIRAYIKAGSSYTWEERVKRASHLITGALSN